jgi:hypothetical protein
MKMADSVMTVMDVVLMAPTPYQTALSHAGTARKLRFSFAFMSPDPLSDPFLATPFSLLFPKREGGAKYKKLIPLTVRPPSLASRQLNGLCITRE